MRIILSGAPGSGKGTQAVELSRKYGLVHISTGNIFREEIAKRTPLGKEVDAFIRHGQLVPDELTMKIVAKKLAQDDCAKGFILDGFHRTIEQARLLEKYLSTSGIRIDKVVYLEIAEDAIVSRLAKRVQCERCHQVYNIDSRPTKRNGVCDSCGGKVIVRSDDGAETVKKRFKVYNETICAINDFYRQAGTLVVVDADKSPDRVTATIVGSMEGVLK